MVKQLDKIYYNTEYRKKIKALSKFNIYIKDRVSKKDVIQEVKLTKKRVLLLPLIYKNLFNFYKLIENVYNMLVPGYFYNLKLVLRLYTKIKKSNMYIYIKNQLILEFVFNGIIFFFYFKLIMNK